MIHYIQRALVVPNGGDNNYQSVAVDFEVNARLLTNLEIRADYEIKVAAYNSRGIGPFSQPVFVFVGEAGKIWRDISAATIYLIQLRVHVHFLYASTRALTQFISTCALT